MSIYLLWYNSSTHIYSEKSYRNCKENEVTNFTISIRSSLLTTFVQNIYLSAICMSLSLNIFSWSPNRILLFHYYSFLSLFSFHFLFSSFFSFRAFFFLLLFFKNIYQLVYRLIHCINVQQHVQTYFYQLIDCIKCTTCSNLFLYIFIKHLLKNGFKMYVILL